jgi:hypothetical protein
MEGGGAKSNDDEKAWSSVNNSLLSVGDINAMKMALIMGRRRGVEY